MKLLILSLLPFFAHSQLYYGASIGIAADKAPTMFYTTGYVQGSIQAEINANMSLSNILLPSVMAGGKFQVSEQGYFAAMAGISKPRAFGKFDNYKYTQLVRCSFQHLMLQAQCWMIQGKPFAALTVGVIGVGERRAER